LITPTLPIRDHAALREALAQGDVPTLLMVLTHFEGDVAFMARFASYIGSIFEPPQDIPEALTSELRERLFAVLTREPPTADVHPDEALMRKMLSTDVGESVDEEFIPMLKEQMGFEPPERRSTRSGRRAPSSDFKVLVIGAGLTGLLAAIKLNEAGYNCEIIEKNPEIGGTWWENTYPGCAVDTPSHFYSYSFELNPDWSHYTPNGPEFQRYLLQDANGKRTVRANAVINAHGPVNRWKMPDIPGLADFQGPVMHTANWDSSVDLQGKRIRMDINWLDTLCRNNVSLEDNTLDHIVEDGIVLRDGSKVEVDIILCATGFSISDMTGGLQIVGRGGRNLKAEWGEDDPRAYLGVTVPGYPNFFLTVGPNSAPNHAGGQNITSETQMHLFLSCPYRLVDYWRMTRAPKREDYELRVAVQMKTEAVAVRG